MAYEIIRHAVSLPSSGDLSAGKFKFVKVNSSGQVLLCSVSGEQAFGVLQNAPGVAGRAGSVADLTGGNVSKVVAGAAVAVGAAVMTDTSGRAITATATNKGLGRALQAAANAGDIIAVALESLGTQ